MLSPLQQSALKQARDMLESMSEVKHNAIFPKYMSLTFCLLNAEIILLFAVLPNTRGTVYTWFKFEVICIMINQGMKILFCSFVSSRAEQKIHHMEITESALRDKVRDLDLGVSES